ncbi:Uncharacterized protein TCM_045897 [Theobroma cacao]|uniref:Uncharacterized protein n=1 Tax=Theobroma cacao TaxID=3641 RepID=S1RTR0_THECC|nr:Uncharacterized protein TCM_045897 [Theobroma cacao]
MVAKQRALIISSFHGLHAKEPLKIQPIMSAFCFQERAPLTWKLCVNFIFIMKTLPLGGVGRHGCRSTLGDGKKELQWVVKSGFWLCKGLG